MQEGMIESSLIMGQEVFKGSIRARQYSNCDLKFMFSCNEPLLAASPWSFSPSLHQKHYHRLVSASRHKSICIAPSFLTSISMSHSTRSALVLQFLLGCNGQAC